MATESYYDRAQEVKEFDDSKIGVKGLVDTDAVSIPLIFVHPPENLIGLNAPPSATQIPTVDLSDLDSPRRPEIVQQIRYASQEFGFFQIVNHGVSPKVMEDTISAVKTFNEQPQEVKAAHYGRETGDGVNFNTNFDLFRSKAASWRDTLQISVAPVPPKWDRVPAVCRRELMEWARHVAELGELLMGLLSEGLGLETDRLKELSFLQGRTVVAHYYPYCPQPDLTLGIASHTDPSLVTVLLQNDVGGLQVKYGEEWTDVEPIKGALVINIGDILQMVSNDVYKSVEHRVVANPLRQPRVTVGIFFNPDKRESSEEYGPLPELISPGKPPIYRNFQLAEFLGKFFGKELGRSLDYFRL
ncbi:DIBOA-glucoside dioxygenase BX6-like [Aristolochia californica]|uniref:DIBOA-glucoside dioxygenase BX6-like n=1 Tax=Aristolochia californica TaxID=171875 RepID=UPI0035DA1B51